MDRHTPEQRRKNMQAVKCRDTAIEVLDHDGEISPMEQMLGQSMMFSLIEEEEEEEEEEQRNRLTSAGHRSGRTGRHGRL